MVGFRRNSITFLCLFTIQSCKKGKYAVKGLIFPFYSSHGNQGEPVDMVIMRREMGY